MTSNPPGMSLMDDLKKALDQPDENGYMVLAEQEKNVKLRRMLASVTNHLAARHDGCACVLIEEARAMLIEGQGDHAPD